MNVMMKQTTLTALLLAILLLGMGVLWPQPTALAQATDTPTPSATPSSTPNATPSASPTPRTAGVRRSVLSNTIRGLGLNAPTDPNVPPCQRAEDGVSAWQNLEQIGTNAQVTGFSRQAGVMGRVTDHFSPAICSSQPIDSATVTHVATGLTLPALVWEYDPSQVQSSTEFYTGSIQRFYVAQLPLEAYNVAGDWRLQIDSPQSVTLDISIPSITEPSGMVGPNGTYQVMGFRAGEQVIGLVFNHELQPDSSQVSVLKDDFEFSVQSQGHGQVTGVPYWNVLSTDITVGLMVVVGNQGSRLYYPLGENGVFIFATDGETSPADTNNDFQITVEELMEYVGRTYWTASTTSGSCDNLLPGRLVVGQRARVLPGLANNVRAAAGLGAQRIGTISGGSEFDVIGGPVCRDGYQWWQIGFNDITGWTAESGDGNYWLEPLTGDAGSTPSVTQGAPTVGFTRTLRLTSPTLTGEDVEAVQARLIALGFDPGPVDGIYGPVTQSAVTAYQQANGLVADGIVGPITWASLFP